eukprot:gene15666-21770_t
MSPKPNRSTEAKPKQADDVAYEPEADSGVDRREQLRRYKEAKQQQQRRSSLGGGMPSLPPPSALRSSRRDSVDGALSSRGGSLGGLHPRMGGGAPLSGHRLPPSGVSHTKLLPTDFPPRAKPTRPTGPPNFAVPPLHPVSRGGALGKGGGQAMDEMTPLPADRLRRAAQVALPPDTEPGRLEGGQGGAGQSPPRSRSPFLQSSRKSEGGGGVCATPRHVHATSSSAGGAATPQDLKSMLRQMRVQELQWRFLNARLSHAAQVRARKSERALAAAVLATAELKAEIATGEALQERSKLVQRMAETANANIPLFQRWRHLQAYLAPTKHQIERALECSLAHHPLVISALWHCC